MKRPTILNVIDNRKRHYRWKSVNAVAEPTWHDNRRDDSDQADAAQDDPDCEERTSISVTEAIRWATALPFAVPLYFDDLVSAAGRVFAASARKEHPPVFLLQKQEVRVTRT